MGTEPRCYTHTVMRRWFLIFLLVLLPMQLSWAAVASYCQHESGGTTTQHLGHHAHEHEADAAPADSSSAKTNSAPNAVDIDCGTCHAGGCAVLPLPLSVLMANLSSKAHSEPALHLRSQPASLPERPNWACLA